MTSCESNYDFAIDFEQKVIKEILSSISSSAEKEFIHTLFEKNLSITPRQEENQFISIDVSSPYSEEINGISKKISNVNLNLKNTISTAIEFALSTGVPETKFDLIKLALLAVLKLYVLSRIELGKPECMLLLYLHEHDAYNKPIHESSLLQAITQGELELTKDQYGIAIKKLIRISSVFIVSGEISLIEKIVLKY